MWQLIFAVLGGVLLAQEVEGFPRVKDTVCGWVSLWASKNGTRTAGLAAYLPSLPGKLWPRLKFITFTYFAGQLDQETYERLPKASRRGSSC